MMFLEEIGEILLALNAQVFGHIQDGKVGSGQKDPGSPHPQLSEIFNGSTTQHLLKDPVKITPVQLKPAGDGIHIDVLIIVAMDVSQGFLDIVVAG